ncbi:ABC transporter permease [Plantactinospora soyae]|uniref:ABC-type transport system involved in multi-copper enzyme maturation permease subunit n=1 Tax=Plantactinospora soyae TaxID=1544732 RepID=A0A927MB33_9ACTN|nr:ABC transporter permease [Plantactinospora soyae]MBE1490437.1 ABC-type transport system involved in multi-copper enzyme maturation permease subunit [Plantactinospora soyae]
MSVPAAVAPSSSAGLVADPPARFRDLLAAEWIKMRSLRSTPWTFGLVTLVVIAFAAVEAWDDYTDFPSMSPETQREPMFALSDAFPLTGYWALALVAVSAGAIAVVNEYGSGLIRTTTVAVPARGAVVLAKAAVVTVAWTVVGTVIAAGSFAVSQAILSGRDASVSITNPIAVRALVASALLAPVCALIGLGLGVLIRHSATTMVTGILVLLVLPSFFSLTTRWSATINHAMVLTAWERLTALSAEPSGDGFYRPTVTESWIVFAAWPLVAVVVALLVVRRRDV